MGHTSSYRIFGGLRVVAPIRIEDDVGAKPNLCRLEAINREGRATPKRNVISPSFSADRVSRLVAC